MKKSLIILVLLLCSFNLFSQIKSAIKKIDWNGYAQIRVNSNFDDYSSAMIRRLKFWIKSKSEFSNHWSYKVQVLFTSKNQEKFFLQDAKINYETGLFSFDLGQFVPAYSLEWTQPDYLIPSIERAKVINALHTDGSIGVRDIGLQANFHSKNEIIESHLGVFNGYGIKEYRFDNKGYMISHKTAFTISNNKNRFQIGYSVQYRRAENLKIPKVLRDDVLFTGIDFRYNLFALYNSKNFDMQIEYLTADFDGQKADGFYVLSVINLNKNQIVLGYEDYNDLINMTNYPYYRLGYNYLFKGNKIKLFFDNFFQVINGHIENYLVSIQLQMFFK